MKTIILLLALLTPTIYAADFSLVAGFGSYHFFNRDYNQRNQAIGLRYGNFDAIYIIENSVGQPSIQVAYSREFYTLESTGTEFRYRIGLASGYKKDAHWDRFYYTGSPLEIGHSGVIPLIAIDIHQRLFAGVNAVIDVTPEVAMFGLEYKF